MTFPQPTDFIRALAPRSGHRYSARLQWLALIAGALTATALTTFAAVAVIDAVTQRHAMATQLHDLRAQRLSAAALITRSETKPVPDFTALLPETTQAAAMVAHLQRAATVANVRLGSVQLNHRPAHPEQLTLTEINIVLNGRYPKLKQVIAEMFAQFPFATLRRMSLQLRPPASEVEASLLITLWARPLRAVAPPAAAAR